MRLISVLLLKYVNNDKKVALALTHQYVAQCGVNEQVKALGILPLNVLMGMVGPGNYFRS